ncbi:putative methyltransferase TARBP1 [Bienertia sinuspersici]
MATLLTSSLSQSFRTVPPSAVPAMLDCILTSTGISSSSLFDSLLPDFSNLTKLFFDDNKKMGSEQCAYLVSYLRGLSHLMKKMGLNSVALECFIWEGFIPLMKMVQLYEREMLHEVVEYLLEVVKETYNWELLEKTLIPILLRSVGLSMNLDQNEDNSFIIRSRLSVFQSSRVQEVETICDNVPLLPLTLSCYLLSCLLDAATESYQRVEAGSMPGDVKAEAFCGHLLWDLCKLTIQMLSQSLEHRSCAASLLLPSIFKAFASKCSFEVCVQGESCFISRQHFFMKLWYCSRALFAQGLTERRDAYGIISLYLSYFSSPDWTQVEMDDRAEGFDIRAEKEFWDEIKRGLVEKEGLIRKQSLYILKRLTLINDGGQLNPIASEKKSHQRSPVPHGMTKRDLWAEEEAKSLGVGQVCLPADNLSEKQKLEAFILLYEMLDEYGTHLVEAAWNHQILLLLQSCVCHEIVMGREALDQRIAVLSGNFDWLAILWKRGLFHDNPHVRCLIMKSFLDIEWKNQGNCRALFPEEFVLGAFIQGLNDPVHHKDFGQKGVLSSKTIEGASKFMYQYGSFLSRREKILFLCKLASVARQLSLGRAGFMSLSECICSASEPTIFCAEEGYVEGRADPRQCTNLLMNGTHSSRAEHCSDKTDLIDSLRFLVENSKQHFNPNYRLRVCEKVLEAAVSVVCPDELSFETILHFIAALPREFTDVGGSLRTKVQKWFAGNYKQSYAESSSINIKITQNLCDFPRKFTINQYFPDNGVHYDDEDLTAWCAEAERWARVLFLHAMEEHHLEPFFMFLEEKGSSICQQSSLGEWIPVKFFVLLLSLVHELEAMHINTNDYTKVVNTNSKAELNPLVDKNFFVLEKFGNAFLVILEEMVLFAESSCSIFWSHAVVDTKLPGSVTGKLGGPSRRRLSAPMTTAVLQAIMTVRTVATVSLFCTHFKEDARLDLAFIFLWKFFHKVVSTAAGDCETSAEIKLAAYEALSSALKASASVTSSSTISLIKSMNNSSNTVVKDDRPLLDSLIWTFLNHVNSFLAVQQLARARRAILIHRKWLCLEAILSIPYSALKNGLQLGGGNTFFSDDAVRFVFGDLVDSLEIAGEDSALSMLRSVRMVLDLLTSSSSFVSGSNGVDAQMMWQLVRSSWVLHTSCNKRRVAPIAALLSAVLHASVFKDKDMHVAADGPGPLKWFCEKVLEEGMKSPRTIRLTALHMSGLWLKNPRVVKYYMKEIKLLTLYGSVAFDEDFEAELTENGDARTEVSLLAHIPDNEIAEVYINTELYARVSVAVLFYKLAEVAMMAGSGRITDETDDSYFALESGKVLLLELLDSAVNDKDLSKELYKKYSAVHRRKVRAWQMLCVLSRFVRQDIVHQVIESLSISLYRNNLPAVRQYLETFAIQVYLKFPFLVWEHLVPILCDYSMKTQALSSYVYIAANVMIHAKAEVQSKHLDELLPPIIPLLTSHHHTLRGFTQLLVYQVFCKLLSTLESTCCGSVILEKRCFSNLKSYLELNPDCARLRASMEGYLDAFNPVESATPAGIFTSRVEVRCISIKMDNVGWNFHLL